MTITEVLIQDSRAPGRDLDPTLPEYEAGEVCVCLWTKACSK
jgi:hypothetical protein